MKFAGLVFVAGVASATTYQGLVNPGTNKCIVEGDYNEDNDQYHLTLGDCSDAVEFKFQGMCMRLRTCRSCVPACLSVHVH